ncbi:MAG: hypothetical protein CSB22_00375 [Deltaproteobacteria bacterium]|nr:MAG: hypothetical protein CSB22_00375 [Deltaproteobacteria bacterium]
MVHLVFLVGRRYLFFVMIFFVISGCTNFLFNSYKEIPRETVMSDGMKICATDNNDNICIVADSGTKRIISWDGEEHSINLIPRKKRWYGELGLVSPKQPDNLWKTEKGPLRVLITEAQIRYKNLDDAVDKLRFPFAKEDGWHIVYNNQGLLIMWHKTIMLGNNTLDISIYQILIDEKKTKQIPGSKSDQIVITYTK